MPSVQVEGLLLALPPDVSVERPPGLVAPLLPCDSIEGGPCGNDGIAHRRTSELEATPVLAQELLRSLDGPPDLLLTLPLPGRLAPLDRAFESGE